MAGFFLVFVAFWAFGLGNSFLAISDIKFGTVQWYSNDKTPIVNDDAVNSQVDSFETSETGSPVSIEEIPTQQIISKTVAKPRALTEEPEQSLSSLEEKLFVFDGNGEVFQVTNQKKPATLSLILKPLHGTLLKKFEITDGKLVIGNNGIPIDHGTLTFLDDKTISLDILHVSSLEPVGLLQGQSDELPANDTDHKVTVNFQKQPLLLSNNDAIPYYLNILGSLSIQH